MSKEQYGEAIKFYTQAIDLSKEKPNHVYFANRGNSYLMSNNFSSCISDCESAI